MAFERIRKIFAKQPEEKKNKTVNTAKIVAKAVKGGVSTNSDANYMANAFRQNFQRQMKDDAPKAKANPWGDPFKTASTQYKSAVSDVKKDVKTRERLNRVRDDNAKITPPKPIAESTRRQYGMLSEREKNALTTDDVQNWAKENFINPAKPENIQADYERRLKYLGYDIDNMSPQEMANLTRELRENPTWDRLGKNRVYNATYHPNTFAFGKGLESGVTLGVSDVFDEFATGYRKEALDTYNANKTGTQSALEFGGNILGSALIFGAAADPMKNLVGKGAEKIIGKEAYAKGSQWLTNLALKHPKTAAFLGMLAEDASINLTVGAFSDLTHSLTAAEDNGTFDADVFWKELGKNAALNWGTGFLVSAIRAPRAGAAAYDNAVENVAKNEITGAIDENVRGADVDIDRHLAARNADDVVEAAMKQNTDDVVEAAMKQNADDVIENVAKQNTDDVIEAAAKQNADEAAEVAVKQNADEASEIAKQNSRRQKEISREKSALKRRRKELLKELEYPEENGLLSYQVDQYADEVETINARLRELNREELAIKKGKGSSKKTNIETEQKVDDSVLSPKAKSNVEQMPEAATDNSARRAEIIEEKKALRNQQKQLARQMENASPEKAGQIDNQIKEIDSKIKTLNKEGNRLSKADRKAMNARGEYTERQTSRIKSEFDQTYDTLEKTARKETGGTMAASRGYRGSTMTGGVENIKSNIESTRIDIDELRANGISFDIKDSNGKVHMVKGDEYLNKAIERTYKEADSIGQEEMIKRIRKSLDSDKLLTEQDMLDMTVVSRLARTETGEIPPDIMALQNEMFGRFGAERGQGAYLMKYIYNSDPKYVEKTIFTDFDNYAKNVLGQTDDSIKEVYKQVPDFEKRVKALAKAKANGMTEEEFRQAYILLQYDIYRHSKLSTKELLNMWRHTALLGKPTTVLNNIVGNESQFLMGGLAKKYDALNERIADYIWKARGKEGAVEKTAVAHLKGDNARLAGELTEGKIGKAIGSGGDDFASLSWSDQRMREEVGTFLPEDIEKASRQTKWGTPADKGADFDYGEKLHQQAKTKTAKGLSKVSGFVGEMLNEPDITFVERNYRRALANYFQANGINTYDDIIANPEIVRKARLFAIREAQENTYKEFNGVANWISNIRMKGNRLDATTGQKLASYAADAILPYDKVPLNIAREGLRYSPVGMVYNGYEAWRALKAGDAQAFSKAARGFSKGEVGTALLGLGMFLASRDPENPDVDGLIANASDEMRDAGVRDYSLMLNGYNVNLANVGSGVTQLMMGAKLWNLIQKKGGDPDDVFSYMDILESQFGPLLEMSVVENVNDLIKAKSASDSPTENMTNVIAQLGTNYVGQYIPTSVRAVARGTTDSDLDTGIPSGGNAAERTFKRQVNQLASGIPYVNQKVLPKKVNAHGDYYHERKTFPQKVGKSAQNLVDPFQIQKVNMSETDKERNKLGVASKKFDPKRKYEVTIGANASKGYASTKETFPLDGKERELVAKGRKYSGKDSAQALIDADFFGDSQGERAQQILREIPEDDAKAQEYIRQTPEYARMSNDEKIDLWNIYEKGRDRTAKETYYVDIAGNEEDDFRLLNDYSAKIQAGYDAVKDLGISKSEYMEMVDKTMRHQWDGEKNKDDVTKSSMIAALNDSDWTTEQKIAYYNAHKQKNWKAWDGVSEVKSGKSSGSGSRYRRYRSRGRSGRSKKIPVPIKPSQYKAEKQTYKSAAAAIRAGNTTASKGTSVKLEGLKIKPPTPKRTR